MEHTKLAYVSGKLAAMSRLKLAAMQLEFSNPQEAAKHMGRRKTIGQATGFAGNVGGGIAGGMLGTAAGGPAGSIAGGLAGGAAGEAALSAPATTLYDVAHDLPQKAQKQYQQTMSRLNVGSGQPAGVLR